MKFVLVPVERKHIAAFAAGQFFGHIAVTTLLAKRHNRQIEVRDAIIQDLRTLATDLSVALYPMDPDRHHQIFTDIRFDQLVRGLDIS
jgi:hypothetical protein